MHVHVHVSHAAPSTLHSSIVLACSTSLTLRAASELGRAIWHTHAHMAAETNGRGLQRAAVYEETVAMERKGVPIYRWRAPREWAVDAWQR